MMKKSIFFIVLISLIVGCESFLEVDEVGKASIPEFFSDMQGIRGAVPGAYSTVYEYYDDGMIQYPDVAGDMLYLNAVSDNVEMGDQYNFISDPQLEQKANGLIWSEGYEALANVNNILKYQPKLRDKFPQNEHELEQIKAQALFLRGLILFDLVRTYAQPYGHGGGPDHPGIPALESAPGPDDNPGRNSVEEVYNQITNDLETSVQIFPDGVPADTYHASKQASKALLARVYLYEQKWNMAAQYAGEVIDQFSLSRGQDYIDMFQTLEVGEETIFALNGDEKNSRISKFYNPNGGNVSVSQKYLNLFTNPNDLRLQLLGDGLQGGSTLKYYLPQLSESEKQHDIIVLRTSEMYLIRAEANIHENNLPEAKRDIKIIKARALQKDPSEIVINANDADALMNVLVKERAKELSFEGHRLFTLTRLMKDLARDDNTTSSVQNISYPDYRFILPIPQTEIEANNNLEQNKGYQ